MGSFSLGTPSELTEPAAVSSAGTLVTETFAEAQGYAEQAWASAFDTLEALKATYPIDWSGVEYSGVSLGGLDGLSLSNPDYPDIAEIVVTMPTFDETAPEFTPITIDDRTVPEFTDTPLPLDIPDPPTDEFPTFDETPPSITQPDLPSPLSLDIPPVPTITDISIPAPPEYDTIDFDATAPVMDLDPPSTGFDYNEDPYTSDLKTALEAKLLNDVVNGGSGLPEATEQAIYDRATSRLEDEESEAYDNILYGISGRGMRVPPGALAAQLLDIENKILRSRTDLNNDILVQQSNLAQENTQFTIAQSIIHENNLMQYTSQYHQRALEASKLTVELAVTIYQVQVEAFKAQLAEYETKAKVFEARIRAETAKAELYRAQIEGVKASVEAQRLYLLAYEAQIQGIQSTIDLYKAEMQAAAIEADINKTQIQSYGLLVEAFKARVGAIEAKYNAYEAHIRGEASKVEIFKAQAQAYVAQIEGVKAQSEVDEIRAKVNLQNVQADIEIYKAAIQRYLAEVEGALKQVEAEIRAEELDVSAYEANVKKYVAEVGALVEVFRAQVDENRARYDLQIKEADLAIKEALGRYQLQQAGIEAAARVYAQLAAAALNSVSASASIGHQESRSDRRGYDVSKAQNENWHNSMSYSYNENHNYSE